MYADPINVSAEARTVLYAHHGEAAARQRILQVSRNSGAHTNTRVHGPSVGSASSGPEPVAQMSAAQFAAMTPEAKLRQAERELADNPVAISSHAYAVLKDKYGVERARRMRFEASAKAPNMPRVLSPTSREAQEARDRTVGRFEFAPKERK